MLDLISCATAALIRDSVVLDPTKEEETAAQGVALVSYMASRDEVCYVSFSGQWAPSVADEGLELLLDGGTQMDQLMRGCIRSDYEE